VATVRTIGKTGTIRSQVTDSCLAGDRQLSGS